MPLDQKHAMHIILISQSLSLHHFFFCFVIVNCVFASLAAVISSHASLSVSAAVFTLPVYSGETKNDLKQGEGKVACGHWWGKTKTTDGLCSVFNPDSTSLILSSLQECPHCMLDPTHQMTIRI